MREVTVGQTILVKDPLLEAVAATVIRIEDKVDLLLAQMPDAPEGRIEIDIGPVREQED